MFPEQTPRTLCIANYSTTKSYRNKTYGKKQDTAVHIDITRLYQSRHEEINESKAAMETLYLSDLFNSLNHLMADMNRALINHMMQHLKVEA